jgi:hypothetical protein
VISSKPQGCFLRFKIDAMRKVKKHNCTAKGTYTSGRMLLGSTVFGISHAW